MTSKFTDNEEIVTQTHDNEKQSQNTSNAPTAVSSNDSEAELSEGSDANFVTKVVTTPQEALQVLHDGAQVLVNADRSSETHHSSSPAPLTNPVVVLGRKTKQKHSNSTATTTTQHVARKQSSWRIGNAMDDAAYTRRVVMQDARVFRSLALLCVTAAALLFVLSIATLKYYSAARPESCCAATYFSGDAVLQHLYWDDARRVATVPLQHDLHRRQNGACQTIGNIEAYVEEYGEHLQSLVQHTAESNLIGLTARHVGLRGCVMVLRHHHSTGLSTFRARTFFNPRIVGYSTAAFSARHNEAVPVDGDLSTAASYSGATIRDCDASDPAASKCESATIVVNERDASCALDDLYTERTRHQHVVLEYTQLQRVQSPNAQNEFLQSVVMREAFIMPQSIVVQHLVDALNGKWTDCITAQQEG